MFTSPKITERRQTRTQTNTFLYICVCVNKAGKKRDFTFCGPAMGPDPVRHCDEWWHCVTTEPSIQTSTASDSETLTEPLQTGKTTSSGRVKQQANSPHTKQSHN